ncbi:MAG: nucleotidyl transferase AbiEii/AbiGii toxin family protein [Polyangiaceae bacterium]|nr:nucleotidyl transferase AbiEii/AbiGii toxin family protein [Polyangiaceae bacterium]
MEHTTLLAPEQRRALDRLRRIERLRESYLAGGTAVALHLGHRRSLDLDFFSQSSRSDLVEVHRSLAGVFSAVRILGETDQALRVECDGARLDFVTYPYPLLEAPTLGESGVYVAGIRHLGTTKLAAIARRGIRRDFWDLYAILATGLELVALGRDYVRRFGVAESDLYHVARSLTFFADAEKDPAFPAGMTSELWRAVKANLEVHGPDILPLKRPPG